MSEKSKKKRPRDRTLVDAAQPTGRTGIALKRRDANGAVRLGRAGAARVELLDHLIAEGLRVFRSGPRLSELLSK